MLGGWILATQPDQLNGRLFDVLAIDEEGMYILTEVKFRDKGFKFKKLHPKQIAIAVSGALNTARQAYFDGSAVHNDADITLKGKSIPSGALVLNPGDYRIQWVIVGPSGKGILVDVEDINTAADLLDVLDE